MRLAVFLLTTVLTQLAFAVNPVEVVGLFKDRAVVRTANGEELIRVGQTSRAGVTLLAADARQAKVSYRGTDYTLQLSNRVGGPTQKATQRSISIGPDTLGQYRVRGSINRRSAEFLVDTGASVVALSSKDAQSLGLDYQTGKLGTVVTAQGEVQSHFITLPTVDIGGVKAHNVAATVISGEYPVDILLGMSFLNQVDMRHEGGVLTLTQK